MSTVLKISASFYDYPNDYWHASLAKMQRKEEWKELPIIAAPAKAVLAEAIFPKDKLRSFYYAQGMRRRTLYKYSENYASLPG